MTGAAATTYPGVQMGERKGNLEFSADKIKFVSEDKTISLPWSKITKQKITPPVFSAHKLRVVHTGKNGKEVSTNFIFPDRKSLVKANKDAKARRGEEPDPSTTLNEDTGAAAPAANTEMKSQLARLEEGFQTLQKQIKEEQEARNAMETGFRQLQEHADNLEAKLREVEDKTTDANREESVSPTDDRVAVYSALQEGIKNLEQQLQEEQVARKAMEKQMEHVSKLKPVDEKTADATKEEPASPPEDLLAAIPELQAGIEKLEQQLQEEQDARRAVEGQLENLSSLNQAGDKTAESVREEPAAPSEDVLAVLPELQAGIKNLEQRLQEEQDARKAVEKQLENVSGQLDAKQGTKLDESNTSISIPDSVLSEKELQDALAWLNEGGLDKLGKEIKDKKEVHDEMEKRIHDFLDQLEEKGLEKLEHRFETLEKGTHEALEQQLQEGLRQLEAERLKQLAKNGEEEKKADEPRQLDRLEYLEAQMQKEQEARRLLEQLLDGLNLDGLENLEERLHEVQHEAHKAAQMQIQEELSQLNMKEKLEELEKQITDGQREARNDLEKHLKNEFVDLEGRRLDKLEEQIQKEQELIKTLEGRVGEASARSDSEELAKLETRMKEGQQEALEKLGKRLQEGLDQLKTMESGKLELQESRKVSEKKLQERLAQLEGERIENIEHLIKKEQDYRKAFEKKHEDGFAQTEAEEIRRLEADQRKWKDAILNEQENQRSRIQELLIEVKKVGTDDRAAKLELQDEQRKFRKTILEDQEYQKSHMSELQQEQIKLHKEIRGAMADLEEEQRKLKRSIRDEQDNSPIMDLNEKHRKFINSIKYEMEDQSSVMMELQEEQRKFKKSFKDVKEDQKRSMIEYHQEQQDALKNTQQTLVELQEEQRRAKNAVSSAHDDTHSSLTNLRKDQGALTKMIRELQEELRDVQQEMKEVQAYQKLLEKRPVDQSAVPPSYQIENLENLMHREQEVRKAAVVELQQDQKVLVQDTKEVLAKLQEEQRKAKKASDDRDITSTAMVEQLKEEQAAFQKKLTEEQKDQRAAVAKLLQEQRNFNNGFRDSLRDLRGEQVKVVKAISDEQETRRGAILDLKQEQKTGAIGSKEVLIERQLKEQRAANRAISNQQDDVQSAINQLQEEIKTVKQEKEMQKTALTKIHEKQKTFEEKTRQQYGETKASLMELLQGQKNFNKSFRESLAQLDKEQEKVKDAIRGEQQKAVPNRSDELEKSRFNKLREKQLQKEVEARKALESLLKEEQRLWQGQQAIIGKLHWDVHQLKLEKQLEEVRNRKNEQDVVIENIKQNIKQRVLAKLNDIGEKAP